ncbi:HTH_Tnp_Tc3_2 domain-containing protein [Trichonephila clavipes]|nr:HTH_Tnp_Tc3_2 domain-containing protein [Trichonephila clavipes]
MVKSRLSVKLQHNYSLLVWLLQKLSSSLTSKLQLQLKTTRREDRRIVQQALVDPTVTRSTIRADVGVAIVPQTISRHLEEANLKSKRSFRALRLQPVE